MGFRGLFELFSSLRNRNFRFYWLAEFPYYFSMNSSRIAQSWLVYEMTKSPFLLGLITAISGIPQVIIALSGGAFADRMEKKKLLFIVQIILGANALGLAVILWIGVVEYWHVVVYSLISQTAMTFGLPARLAIVSEIVSKEEFMNAYGFYYVALNLLGIVGPALGGVLVESIGIAGIFFIITACQWSFNVPLLMIRSEKTTAKPQLKGSMTKSIIEILSFARHNRTILILMGLKVLTAFLTMPAQSLMPVFAADILGVGAVGFGVLTAAAGIGRLVGSFIMVSISKTKRKTILLLVSCITQGIALFLFAMSSSFYLCFAIRLFSGIAGSAYLTLNSSLFQLSATDDIRGRIMGLYMISFNFIGPIPMSAAAETLGVPFTIAIGGGLFTVFSIAVLIFLPSFRHLHL